MDQDFAGKVVIVTGAAGGIGAAAAQQMAARGAAIVAADVQGCADTVATITKDGGRAIDVAVDVREANSVRAMVRETLETFGRLDAACNNAGVSHDVRSFHEADVDE